MLLTLNFNPIFVYVAFALSGVIGLARFLNGDPGSDNDNGLDAVALVKR
jgi:hypothetical protein